MEDSAPNIPFSNWKPSDLSLLVSEICRCICDFLLRIRLVVCYFTSCLSSSFEHQSCNIVYLGSPVLKAVVTAVHTLYPRKALPTSYQIFLGIQHLTRTDPLSLD